MNKNLKELAKLLILLLY